LSVFFYSFFFLAQVTVGHPLFELDTEGVATTTTTAAPAPAAPAAAAASQPAAASAAAAAASHTGGRTPLIKFLGKRSLLKGAASSSSAAGKVSAGAQPVARPTPVAKVVKEGNGVDFATLKGGAWYGRPRMSDAEMRAIESGGAET
jgi:2-oxoglutarate dehydrogenase E2 component (dihydrolipoamide succinyltransferase)